MAWLLNNRFTTNGSNDPYTIHHPSAILLPADQTIVSMVHLLIS